MMNKQERIDFDRTIKENERLRAQRDRLLDEKGKAEETIADLELIIEKFESNINKSLKEFKQKIVERLTGTPPEDQRI